MQSAVRRVSARVRVALARARSSPGADEQSPLRRLLRDASAHAEAAGAGELQWATQPYASAPAACADAPAERSEPRDATVLLFPGQGSQYVGMGRRLRDVPAARELYDLAASVVGWDVWRVCTEGPAALLHERCQVCVLVTALAALERARDERPGAVQRARAAAGFSLGEIAALVFAGALQLPHALRLAELRAAAMGAAARERPGGMLTLWLAPDARLGALLAEARARAAGAALPEPVCEVAGYLSPGCKVVAGDEAALRALEAQARAFGVRRTARVAVAGAFHCALMARAEAAVREALRALPVAAPRLRVVSCVDARAVADAAGARRRLARLTAAPLRWEQALHALYARPRGAPQPLTLALGPGGALRSTLKLVNARAWDASLQVDA
ncbi:probable malonyl-CoA-acyl carrier protein transacylase, mitochondrial [Bicyclus anynana]|uniref:Probable malonyl-CoA-acyl carrier protein transacylase, mitochondrial n=1 Tax=Bicyclus anynana TaxID=110368 RepID=A0A6J1ND80_BICAN|nr:probable malonyl-CoA-acyl carrier protein transacylase, mitochondrial [Bicyclus anynana]